MKVLSNLINYKLSQICSIFSYKNFVFFHSPSGSGTILTRSNTGSSMKRPDTAESLNSSVSNGTNDAGKRNSQII